MRFTESFSIDFIFMKNKFFIVLCTLVISINLNAQNNANSHKIIPTNNVPDWAQNLSTIHIGNYFDYVSEGILNIVGFIGDEFQKPEGKTPPFTQFLYTNIDGENVFLEFKNIQKLGKHYIHTYENKNKKIILDWNGIKQTESGNGDGGLLKVYLDGKLVITTSFFWVR